MTRAALGFVVLASGVVAACHTDMYEQPKLRAFEESSFFADGSSARRLPAGTVARMKEPIETWEASGLIDGTPAKAFPFALTAADLARGRERYDIYCAPCHGRLGDGAGMIVARGFKAPPSFHDPQRIDEPPGRIVDAIAHGTGAMYPFADRIGVRDRWAIAGYIRALVRSQRAHRSDVPSEARAALEKATR